MEQQRIFGDFHSILSESGTWKIGGFPLPDGSFWEYREPNAVVIVRNGILYVRAPLSRQNDQIQFSTTPSICIIPTKRWKCRNPEK